MVLPDGQHFRYNCFNYCFLPRQQRASGCDSNLLFSLGREWMSDVCLWNSGSLDSSCHEVHLCFHDRALGNVLGEQQAGRVLLTAAAWSPGLDLRCSGNMAQLTRKQQLCHPLWLAASLPTFPVCLVSIFLRIKIGEAQRIINQGRVYTVLVSGD